MDQQNDKLKGTFNTYAGKAKESVGKVLDNKEIQFKDFVQKVQSKEQQLQGIIQEKIQRGTHAVEDAIEKVGNKIEHMAD